MNAWILSDNNVIEYYPTYCWFQKGNQMEAIYVNE